MSTIPVYWGNNFWELDSNDHCIPNGKLSKGDPHWINYEKIEGTSVQLSHKENPGALYRLKLHNQILEKTLDGCEAFVFDKPHCILTHGGIASGKTSAIELFLSSEESKGRYLYLGFDKMKKQLPEFVFMMEHRMKKAATYTQTESAKLAGKAFKRAVKLRLNIIYEGSLADSQTIHERIREMKKKEYQITIISTFVTEAIGRARALKRFENGGRFVPDKVVVETYQKCPESLLNLKTMVDDLFLIDNRPENQPSHPMLVLKSGHAESVDKQLYSEYLKETGNKDLLGNA